MKRSSRPFALAAIALAAITLAALTGCSLTNQQTTQLEYRPADGEQVDLGGVGVYSMVLVTASADDPGTFIGRVVNTTLEPQIVSLTGTGDAVFEAEVEVAPRETLDLGPEAEQVLVEPAGAAPGRTVPVRVAVGEEAADVLVPVFDDTFDYYADLVPDGSAG